MKRVPAGDGASYGLRWRAASDTVLATVPTHVRALRADDPVGASTLVAWWRSFSRSFAHHMRTEDARIWPTIAAADPTVAEDLGRLTAEHHEIERQLDRVDSELDALPELLASEWLESTKRELLGRLDVLQGLVDHHLAGEERIAFVAGQRCVAPEEWSRIERDMVKGLSLREVSLLLPRLLEQADPVARALMLQRMPAPVRVLDARVFEPRYRRMQRRLPGAASR